MATVVKNFRIKSGLIVEGTTGTINGQNILTEGGSDNYILNLIGGETLVKSVDSHLSVDGSGKLSINRGIVDTWYDAAGSADTAYDNAVSTAASDATTKANAAESNAISTASTDATNKANAALASAQTYADNAASSAQTAAQGYADTVSGNAYTNAVSDAQTFANNAYNNATDYADGILTQANGYTDSVVGTEVGNRNSAILDAINTEVTNRNNAISTAKSEAISSANTYTDQEIAALVDSAPALLDTLSELAAAISNNPNYATDVANLVAGKQDTLEAGNGIVIDGNLIYVPTSIGSGISVTPNTVEIDRNVVDTWYDAAGAASSAQSAAETYTDNAVNSLTAGDTQFTEVSIGWMTDQVASYAYANTGSEVVAYSWNHNKGASAKFLVRMRNGNHSQVSEILLTRDNSNNIAISEYGIVTTNGILGDITAEINGSNIELKVSPTHNDGTEIIVSGTLMSYGD